MQDDNYPDHLHLKEEINKLQREKKNLENTLKEMEDSLREEIEHEKQRFLDISKAAGEYIWEVDTQGNYTFLTDMVTNILGYAREDMLGHSPFEFMHEQDLPHVLRVFHQSRENKQPFRDLIHRSISRDGRIIWQSVTGLPVIDKDNNVTGYRGTGLDITEKKLTRDKIEENEKKIRVMSQASYDAIIGINDQGKVEFWNKAAEKMFGYMDSEVLGKELHGFIAPPEDRKSALKGLPEFARSGRGQVIGKILEMTGVRKDKTTFPVERSVTSYKIGDKWHAVGNIRDITEKKKAEDKLKKMATTDSLTGLFNRRRFMELAAGEIKRSTRYSHPLCLGMLDIDYFKHINDSYGHDAGDAVLKALGRILVEHLREQDILARIGGEEFAILFPETDLKAARATAERLRLKIKEFKITHGQQTINISASFGIAALKDSGPYLENLLKKSDLALYQAKDNGRNRVETG